MRPGVDATNRTALFILGLVLTVAGALGLILGWGAFGTARAGAPVWPAEWGTYAAANPWLWWVLGALALLVAFLALRWLLAQLRTDQVSRVDLTTRPRDGSTVVHAGAVCHAIEARVNGLAGVARSSAWLDGPVSYRLALGVDLTDRADLAYVRSALETGVVEDTRRVLGEPGLPVEIQLRPHQVRATSRGLG